VANYWAYARRACGPEGQQKGKRLPDQTLAAGRSDLVFRKDTSVDKPDAEYHPVRRENCGVVVQ
jgi:hypothetical protein